MSAININTATKEQLMKIKDIGDRTAEMIIRERETKGPLDVEALKAISSIPAHTWDPLLAAKKIVFEEPTEVYVEEQEVEQLKKIVEQMRTENLILQQAEARNVMEFKKERTECENQLQSLQTELNAFNTQNKLLEQQLQEKDAHIEKLTKTAAEAENVQQQNMKEEILKQRMLFAEQSTKLQQDNEKLKEERQRLMEKIEEQTEQVQLISEQDQLHRAQIDDLENRVKNLMTKIEEQAHDKDKAEEMVRYSERENHEQETKIKKLEEEIQHFKASKAVDDLAPKSMYTGKLASDTKTTEDAKKTEVKSSGELQTMEDAKTTETKDTDKDMTGQQEQWRKTFGLPPFPKMSTYDGTSDWKAYKLQFTHTATQFEWDDQQKIDNLLLRLRGKALKFFSTRPISVQNNFAEMMDKMSTRFGNEELPHSIRSSSRSPSPAGSLLRRTNTCLSCGEVGHYSRECQSRSSTPLKDQGSGR